MWEDCTAAIESETNSYWATRNLGGLLGAIAAPTVPHNAAIAAILDRAVAASKQWAGQGAPLVVAKALLWAGEFNRAFAPYPAGATPEPLVEFAFETLADKPELGRQDALWKLAMNRLGDSPPASQKAIHALAFSGRLNQALAIATRQVNPTDRIGDEILAARYARYGGHDGDFAQAMGIAAGDLHLLPQDASRASCASKPSGRDKRAAGAGAPRCVLEDSRSLGRPPCRTVILLPPLRKLQGASAWAGRDDALSLLPALSGTSWQDAARMRVACGWLWNGKREQAAECAAAIKDPEWRSLTAGEMGLFDPATRRAGECKMNLSPPCGWRLVAALCFLLLAVPCPRGS